MRSLAIASLSRSGALPARYRASLWQKEHLARNDRRRGEPVRVLELPHALPGVPGVPLGRDRPQGVAGTNSIPLGRRARSRVAGEDRPHEGRGEEDDGDPTEHVFGAYTNTCSMSTPGIGPFCRGWLPRESP